jgi:hypothetical protein
MVSETVQAAQRLLAERERVGIEDLNSAFIYDAETGVLLWRETRSHNAVAGQEAGYTCPSGYRHVMLNGKMLKVHRIAWAIFYGRWPDAEIDHIDGHKSNNRIRNLRDADRTTQAENIRKARSDNKTGFLGVSQHRGKFVATIRIGKKKKFLGYRGTPEEAHALYLEAKRQHHAGCTL